MSDELKPCPFCGGEAVLNTESFSGVEVFCIDCIIGTGTRSSIRDAINMWNTRPAEDALKAENERLKEALAQIGIAMLYSEDEKADEIFKLCEENVGDSLKKAYVEKMQEDIEKMGLNPDTGKGGEDEP